MTNSFHSGKTISVDLDGVIHKYSGGFRDGRLYDAPVPGARDALAKLVAAGFTVVICTTRLNPGWGKQDVANQYANISEWLGDNDFQQGVHFHELTNNKPAANWYIDDRAIRFTNWEDTKKYFV